MYNNTDEVFKTSNLNLAAALLSLKHDLLDISFKETGRAIFIFTDSEQLQEDIDAFWKERLSIEPLNYFQQLKSLKARIYEEK